VIYEAADLQVARQLLKVLNLGIFLIGAGLEYCLEQGQDQLVKNLVCIEKTAWMISLQLTSRCKIPNGCQ
jgi:hypothetical protein